MAGRSGEGETRGIDRSRLHRDGLCGTARLARPLPQHGGSQLACCRLVVAAGISVTSCLLSRRVMLRGMTKLLTTHWRAVRDLPPNEQDKIATPCCA